MSLRGSLTNCNMKLVLHLIGGVKRLLKKPKKKKNKHPSPLPQKRRKKAKSCRKQLYTVLRAARNVGPKNVYIPLTKTKPIDPQTASVIAKLYNEQEAERKKKKKQIRITNHAKFRFAERFNPYGYTLEQLLSDATCGRKSVKLVHNNNYLVRWQLWKYIISKDLYIVTMFPYASKKSKV